MKVLNLNNPGTLFWRLIFPAGTLVAVLAQLISTTCGLGLTYDSHLYLSGAEYFKGILPGPITEQAVFQAKPPLFPWLLSWLPGDLLPYLFAILLIANLFLLAQIISVIFTPGFWKNITFLAIAVFTPLIMVHVYLWTEPVFLVLLYASVLLIVKGQRHDYPNILLMQLGSLAILMVMTRHVGLFFIFGLTLAVILSGKLAWRKALLTFLPSLLFFGFWNFGLMGEGLAGRFNTFIAPVSGGTWSRVQNFHFFFETAATWFVPHSISGLWRMILLAGLVLFVIFGSGRVNLRPVKAFLIVGLTYYLLMHAAFLIDESSADRYLAPIYPLMLMTFFYFLSSYFNGQNVWLKYLLAFWLLYPATRTIKNALFWKEKLCEENLLETAARIQDNSAVRQE